MGPLTERPGPGLAIEELRMIETTLCLISRVRVAALLAQHEAGGAATLWQIERAFRPAREAWLRSWADPRDRQVRGASTSIRPAGSRSTAAIDGGRRSTGSQPSQVRAVEGAGGVVG